MTRQPPGSDPEAGVSLALATERARTIERVRYDLAFDLPADIDEPVHGRAIVRLVLKEVRGSLVLDFAPGAAHVESLSVNGSVSPYRCINGHLVVSADVLELGENALQITFRAGAGPFNRTPGLLYTLFVPARAHQAFPCFDQPDLKASFTLELTVPAAWKAVANEAEVSREPLRDRVRIRYAPSPPIPTYLFAFAAGAFHLESAERDGRPLRLFHMETDHEKVARNRNAIFDLHASSIAWLESYTGIALPFAKHDVVLIPSFQFGGMEHPGAVFYSASALLLDESASEDEILKRASLIAHETAHMWFGNLVTMRWFDDVWLKEVCASFMAAKIVDPAFPKLNHELRFLLAHYPAAYAVDRSAGTHPIRQPLANLNNAGSLYGPLIYQKAPIVMRQLELLIGAEHLRAALCEYLRRFAFGNAAWPDLVGLLEEATGQDLMLWSRAWIDEAGRPTIRTEIERDATGGARHLSVVQSDPDSARALRWTARIDVLLGRAPAPHRAPLTLIEERTDLPGVGRFNPIGFVLPAGGGLAYGDCVLDPGSREYLLEHLPDLTDPVDRGATWVVLWDELLGRRLSPSNLIDLALRALPREDVEQNTRLVLGYLQEAFWRFLSHPAREVLGPAVEEALLGGLGGSSAASMRATYFAAFRAVVTTTGGVGFLERVWRREETRPALTFSETDETEMALDLAVRDVPASEAILEQQRARLTNPERIARFQFIAPSVSGRQETRDAFFARLTDPANRRREPWVVEGIRYLNHPLRAETGRRYLPAALGLLEEIQQTGDIFLPKRWMDATLNGHNTIDAARVVRQFLADHPDYPPDLRRIIFQSADHLFRAATPASEVASHS